MKKLLSLTLALIMVFALCSVGTAYADNPVVKIGVSPSPATTARAASRKSSACSMPTS